MKIWANCIVHNEENFIWFALNSVIDYVDTVLIWDTGSKDRTVEIVKKIKHLKRDKIEFREVGYVGDEEFPKIRQKMLDESKSDWILILDGDEIWWDDSIKKLISEINKKGRKIEGIVVPMVVPVGDIYHIQDEKAGKYNLLGKTGHMSLKAFSKSIPGLHVDLPYGKEGFFDKDDKLIQEREEIIFVDAPFFHATHLKRSSKIRRNEKFKYELGDKVSRNFKFPEILFKHYPPVVPSPWTKISGFDLIKAVTLTPLRKINRRLKDE